MQYSTEKQSTVQRSRVQYRRAEYSTEEQSWPCCTIVHELQYSTEQFKRLCTFINSSSEHVVPLYMNYSKYSTVQYKPLCTFINSSSGQGIPLYMISGDMISTRIRDSFLQPSSRGCWDILFLSSSN